MGQIEYMRISVVIPNFNDVRVDQAIRSVVGQEYPGTELIVVDGGSTHGDVRACYKAHSSSIGILISEPDKGIFDALNKGIRAARGDIVYLMGADDRLSDKTVFADVVKTFQRHERADGVCMGCVFTTNAGKVVRKWFPRTVSSRRIRWGLMPPHFSLFLNRGLYEKVGLFDTSYSFSVGNDSEWLLRMAVLLDVTIPVIRTHCLIMGYGGSSTGSLKNVFRAYGIIAKSGRRMGVKQWWLIPLIKVFSKVPQFRVYGRTPSRNSSQRETRDGATRYCW